VLHPELCLVDLPAEWAHEHAAEALRLDEAGASFGQRLEPEAVLTVKQAGDQQAHEPAQLAAGLDGENGLLENPRLATGRRDQGGELRAFVQVAAEPGYERVPFAVGRGVGQAAQTASGEASISISCWISRVRRRRV